MGQAYNQYASRHTTPLHSTPLHSTPLRPAPLHCYPPSRRPTFPSHGAHHRCDLQRAYRPAHQRPIGDDEKKRMAEICTYKGGRALPEEMTNPVLDVR